MSDEVKATNYECDDRVGGESSWLEWLIIIFVIFCLLGGGNNLFGRGGFCR